MTNFKDEIRLEFEHAESARMKNNEGQARVCARRAAGIAIRDYFGRRGIRPPRTSAYDLLNLVKEEPLLSPDLRLIADHLTLRVTEEHSLPGEIDLVKEARIFCESLLTL